MIGTILSLKWTALFYLLVLSICCNPGHGAALPGAPAECGEYEGATGFPEEWDCAPEPELESAAYPEPNEYPGSDQDRSEIEKRGDGTEPRAFTPIVGCDGMAQRLPIMVLMNKHPDVFNMLILALERVQNWPETRELSWFQLSGIHGFPFRPWQYPPSATVNPGLGYCTHNSAIFVPWHTPYLLLMEQILWREARDIATQFTGAQRTRYAAAANRVRLPYWDWASPGSQSRIPPALKQSQITVVKPAGSRTIPNPLYSYRFLRGSPGQGFGPTTRRGPNDDTLAQTYPGRRQSTLDFFTRTRFNDASSMLEGIHNNIHVFIGGDMPVVTRSAFDPIFWLHHCNVDRLMTMYQATHPGVRLTPRPRSPTFALGGNGPDTLTTPLYPFRHPGGQEWTSNDINSARSIHQYGYSYPEVPPNLAQPQLRTFTTQRINALYRPNLQSAEFKSLGSRDEDSDSGTVSTRLEWSCNVQYDMRELSGPSYRIMFYLDSEGSQNLVGVASIFAGMNSTVEMPDSTISMDVPLTPDLVNPSPNLNPSSVVPLLTDQLYWTVERVNDDGTITTVPVEDIPSLKIATFSTLAKYPDSTSQLPSKANETIYLDPTKDKEGGLSPVDDTARFVDLIGDDVPDVIEGPADDGPTDDGPTDDGPTDDSPPDDGSADDSPADGDDSQDDDSQDDDTQHDT